MSLDCCWRNTNLLMGFPAVWLRVIFLESFLFLGLGVSLCVVDSDDLCLRQKTLVEIFRADCVGFQYVYEWKHAGCDRLWFLLHFLNQTCSRRWVKNLTHAKIFKIRCIDDFLLIRSHILLSCCWYWNT